MAQALTTWKEIAAFMGKGVRTVQRWEREMQFPLHRPHADRGVVIAYPDEIDAWIKRRSVQSVDPQLKLEEMLFDVETLVKSNPQLRAQAAFRLRALMIVIGGEARSAEA